MLRAFLARLGVRGGGDPAQLELGIGAGSSATVGAPAAAPRAVEGAAHPKTGEPRPDAQALLARLQSAGLHGITSLRITRNRSTLVSFRGRVLRLHGGFRDAPDEVLRAIAVFVVGRGAARRSARRVILAYPLPRDAVVRPRKPREALHPDDVAIADRLSGEHARLNTLHFGGVLRPVRVGVSRRMRSRLGHYAAAAGRGEPDIVISRRHLRRHGWDEAVATLLHEMVHQWQEENAHPLDHGPTFRRKAREVGVTPRARRVLR